jgi:hypothetical protein
MLLFVLALLTSYHLKKLAAPIATVVTLVGPTASVVVTVDVVSELGACETAFGLFRLITTAPPLIESLLI